ncbi:YfjI family protein [Endozoicomonas sp. YOMI1]|uniref:YfjI family protein n=1 Tax=Endozoicomonas sp. YOMI1 TaxID=2828739 RepID=UPI0021490E2D|nr:YfjI family protein [Endozoicomonas sp. YOMI1]
MSINNDIAGQLNPANSSPEIKWKKPEPIEKGLLPVPEFPSNILPHSIEKWIQDIAFRKDGAPVDFPAVSAMVALSSLLGSKVVIHPKRYDEWSVIPNLWGAIIGNPSMKKTPCITDALKPIKGFEKKCFDRYQDEMKDHQADLKLEKLQEKQFYGDVLKETKNNNSKAKEMLREAEYNAPEPPILKRYLVNDSSIEKHPQKPNYLYFRFFRLLSLQQR